MLNGESPCIRGLPDHKYKNIKVRARACAQCWLQSYKYLVQALNPPPPPIRFHHPSRRNSLSRISRVPMFYYYNIMFVTPKRGCENTYKTHVCLCNIYTYFNTANTLWPRYKKSRNVYCVAISYIYIWVCVEFMRCLMRHAYYIKAPVANVILSSKIHENVMILSCS